MIRNLLLGKLPVAWGAGTWCVPSQLPRVATDASGAVSFSVPDSHLRRNLSFRALGGHRGLSQGHGEFSDFNSGSQCGAIG